MFKVKRESKVLIQKLEFDYKIKMNKKPFLYVTNPETFTIYKYQF